MLDDGPKLFNKILPKPIYLLLELLANLLNRVITKGIIRNRNEYLLQILKKLAQLIILRLLDLLLNLGE